MSCYNHFGAGRKVEAAAGPKQLAITQFFKKQKQEDKGKSGSNVRRSRSSS